MLGGGVKSSSVNKMTNIDKTKGGILISVTKDEMINSTRLSSCSVYHRSRKTAWVLVRVKNVSWGVNSHCTVTPETGDTYRDKTVMS